MTGIYIHIPYCVKKCGYCDFYSVCDLSSADSYTAAVCDKLNRLEVPADTLYFGGGTPSLIGANRICRMINSARRVLTPDVEITVELNPGDNLSELVPAIASVGVNRISIGMQSHNDNELKLLTRRHNAAQVDAAVNIALKSGISNISLDLMLGIEGQTEQSLLKTLKYCAESGATHISAYMLKIEQGTPFERSFFRPDDDMQCDLYKLAVARLAELGFVQYEISNFCKNGMVSRHNMKYWTGEDYIGIGAAAHSYINGKRFYYPRDIASFVSGAQPIADSDGGGFEEEVMLRLRLASGLDLNVLSVKYPSETARVENIKRLSNELSKVGLCSISGGVISFTVDGFLVSNEIIGRFIGDFD